MGLEETVDQEIKKKNDELHKGTEGGKLKKNLSYKALVLLKGGRVSKFFGKCALGIAFGDLSGKVQEDTIKKLGIHDDPAILTKFNLGYGIVAIAQTMLFYSNDVTKGTFGKLFEFVYLYPPKIALQAINAVYSNDFVQSTINYIQEKPEQSIELMIAGITTYRLGYVLITKKPIMSYSFDYAWKTGLRYAGIGIGEVVNLVRTKALHKPRLAKFDIISSIATTGKRGYDWLAAKVNDAYDTAHQAIFHNGLFNGNDKQENNGMKT